MCDESTTPMPVSATACTTVFRNSRRASGSSEATGSSSSSSCGRFASASVSATWACWPPDSVPTRWPSERPSSSMRRGGERVVPVRIQLSSQPERLGDPEPARQRVVLRDEADVRQHRPRLGARIVAEHGDGACGRLEQSDRELQERGLAGAVRADERRHRSRAGSPGRSRAAPRSSRTASRAPWCEALLRSCDARDRRRSNQVREAAPSCSPRRGPPPAHARPSAAARSGDPSRRRPRAARGRSPRRCRRRADPRQRLRDRAAGRRAAPCSG